MEIRRSYDRLISTMGFPILVRLHLYIESGPRPQCINSFPSSAVYICCKMGSSLVMIMAYLMFGAKPLHKPLPSSPQLHPNEKTSVKKLLKLTIFH